MREILFRGRRVDTGELVYGDLVYSFEGTHIVVSEYFKPSNGEFPELVEVDPISVVQYTGVKDCNGVKLFDKDLVKSHNGEKLFAILWKFNGWKLALVEYNGIKGHNYSDLYEGDLELYIPTEPIICVAI